MSLDVTRCGDCPFRVGANCYHLSQTREPRFIGRRVGDPTNWCPLRRGPTLVRLVDEKSAADTRSEETK